MINHNFIRFILFILFTLVINYFFELSAETFFSETYKTTTIQLENDLKTYNFYHEAILPLSEKVQADTSILLRDIDYNIDYTSSIITLKKEINNDFILITYAIYPEDFKIKTKQYSIEVYSDSLISKRSSKDLFSNFNQKSKLNISGNKTFSISVSNQDDVNINQSLYLKLDGEISENVRIEAQLNDSQSPLSSEGDTKELSSLDQVYFKVFSPHYEIAFGDLELKYDNTKFINYLNKFEGMKLSYHNINSVQGAIALSKSKNSDIEFFGSDGKQGPYYLKPDGSAYNVKILSGTEEISLDGQLLNRGEDYLIDYSEGTITFTTKYFISSNNRIRATFQYSDDFYRKNLYLTESKTFFSDRFYFYTHSIMQTDDKNNPLEMSFTNNEKLLLKEGGDQPIYTDGAVYVGPGLGSYQKIESGSLIYYEYSTDSLAVYNVYFTYMGQGKGTYRQTGTTRYEYVGENIGDWNPIKRLVTPVFKANWDVITGYTSEFISVEYEGLLSDHDKNTFSTKDSYDDISYIQNLQTTITPDWDRINPILFFEYRQKEKNLITFSTIDETEDYQFYELNLPDSLNSNSYLGRINTSINKEFNHEFYYRKILSYGHSNQQRISFIQNNKQMLYLPYSSYQYSYGFQDFVSKEEKEKTIHDFSIGYTYKKVDFKQFLKTQEYIDDVDSVKYGQKMNTQQSVLSLQEWQNLNSSLSYKNEDNLNLSSSWNKINTIKTYSLLSLYNTERQTTNLSISHRNINWFNLSQNNQKFDLIEIKSNQQFYKDFLQLNLSYSINNLEFFTKIRELQYVGSQTGIYDSTGVISEDGEYDYVYIQSGAPEQTTEVKNDMNFFVNPGTLVNNNFLKKLQIETWIMINENSRYEDKYKIYWLDFNHLMDDSTSIYAKQILKQTLWYNMYPSKFLLKYTYLNDKTLDNRYQSISKNSTYSHDFSARLFKWLKNDWEGEYSFGEESDSRYETESKKKSYKLMSNYNLSNTMILNSTIGLDKENTYYVSYQSTSDLTKLSFIEDILIFIGSKYRFNSRFEFSQNSRVGSENSFISAEKRKGETYKWSCSVYYKMNQYTSLTGEYSGYDYPLQRAFHQMKVEIKAEF